jgi:cytoplasmic iron level regulating protein YaaA (DUF328/UPF0246 family)
MRILLPPSEAKHPGGRGRSLTARDSGSDLEAARREVLTALRALLATPQAATNLMLPPSVAAAALTANANAASGPTLPAMHRYAGVVYDGLAVAGLSEAARKLARRELIIFSGLLGASRGGDPVPDYRLPAKAQLPGIGTAATYWRRRLAVLLPPLLDGGLILDLRSSDYAAMWRPAADSELATRLIGVRILSRTPAGKLAVVSYPSKLAKGRLTAALLERRAAGDRIASAEEVLAAWTGLGGDGHIVRTGSSTALELVE